MIDNRDLALLIWLGIVLVIALFWRDARSGLKSVLSDLLHPAISLIVVAMAAYVGVLLYFGSRWGIWNTDLAYETAFWFVVSGFGLLLNLDRVAHQEHFLKRTVFTIIGATLFFEFYINLYSFSLPIELFLVPIFFLLGAMYVYAESGDRSEREKNLVETILALVGLGLAVYVLIRLIGDWDRLDKAQALRTLALPVWLTVGVLPYIYLVGLFSSYGACFRSVNDSTTDRRTRLRAKGALILEFRYKAREVGSFGYLNSGKLGSNKSLKDARRVITDFQDSQEQQQREETEYQERLERYAGVDGEDDYGERLDKREFRETREALKKVNNTQMGWYRNRGNRYRPELVDKLAPYEGLLTDHGISIHVASDGQSWWALRRTVSGWCFAIGAAGPPLDEWFYDGPEPPTGFPGQDPAWGERWGVEAKNW